MGTEQSFGRPTRVRAGTCAGGASGPRPAPASAKVSPERRKAPVRLTTAGVRGLTRTSLAPDAHSDAPFTVCSNGVLRGGVGFQFHIPVERYMVPLTQIAVINVDTDRGYYILLMQIAVITVDADRGY